MYPLRKPNSVRACARSEVWRRGATLIELLVVIALMGLLVGMLIPSIGRSMQMAAATLCKHHLREIGHSLILYRMDNDGWLPAVGELDGGTEAIRQSEPWFAKLFTTYLQDPSILTCPEDPFRFRILIPGGDLSDPITADYSSYGINSFIMTSGDGALAEAGRLRSSRPLDTLLVADLGPDIADSNRPRVSGAIGPSRNSSLLAWDDGFDPFETQTASAPWLTKRHNLGINVLTLDGGVRKARTSHILQQPVQRYYADCAAAGCTFCTRLALSHYSFARDHLYWWTGLAPSE